MALSQHSRRTMSRATLLATALACVVMPARGQQEDNAMPSPATSIARERLDAVEVVGRHYDNAVGTSDAASEGVIRSDLLQSRPAFRPGEILEFVPGVIVTQHSGDGKANQYFLRGFNLDHGTDFATTVNGLPVNMPTHGHGQGYSDLNFLIPELVSRIEYRKGPYFAKNGDFASGGSADIVYRNTIDAPFAAITLGQRGYRRGVAAGSTEIGSGIRVLGAIESQRNDGPWTVPEDLHRTNAVLTLSGGNAMQGWTTSLMSYDAGGHRPIRLPSAWSTPSTSRAAGASDASIRSTRPTGARPGAEACPVNGIAATVPT